MDVQELRVELVRVDSEVRPRVASVDGETFHLPSSPHAEFEEQVEDNVRPIMAEQIRLPDKLLDRVEAAWAACHERTVLRLNFVSGSAELLDLPWELAAVPIDGDTPQICGHERLSVVRTPLNGGVPHKTALLDQDMAPLAVLAVCLPEQVTDDPILYTRLDGGTDTLSNVSDVENLVADVHEALVAAGFSVRVCASASLEKLADALDRPSAVVCYLGHGVPEGPILLRDRELHVEPAEKVAAVVGRAGVDLVLLLSCLSATGLPGPTGSSLAQSLVRHGVRTAVGMNAKLSPKLAVAFAETFLSKWNKGDSLDEAMIAGRARLAVREWPAARGAPAVYTSVPSRELTRRRRAPRFDRARFVAEVLPTTPRLDDHPPAASVRRRLDTCVVPRRDGFAEVIVDDHALAATLVMDLNAADHTLGSRLQVRQRRWFDLRERRADDHTSLDEIGLMTVDNSGWTDATDDRGTRTGVVLRWHVVADRTLADHVERESATVHRIRQLLPGAAVITTVTADRPLDALVFGANLAVSLDLARVVLRHGDAAPVREPGVATDRPLAALTGMVADQVDELVLDWVPTSFPEDSGGRLPKPVRVVAALNEARPHHDDEVRFLRAVRAVFPSYHRELLKAHARRRERPWAGLEVAADRDDDLADWWHAADRTPGDIPSEVITREVAAAVLARLMEKNRPEQVYDWVRRAGRTVRRVGALVKHTASGWDIDLAAAADLLGDEAELAARVAVRLNRGLDGLRRTPVEVPFFWALMGRTALNDLLSAIDEKAARRVVERLGPLPVADIEERAVAEQLRAALWTTE